MKFNSKDTLFESELNPWDVYPDIWPTKASFFSWLRGAIRRSIWDRYPPKLQFKNANCFPPPEGYNGRAKTGTNCALTGEWEGKSKLEVDHIENGTASLREWEDVTPFIQHLVGHGYDKWENFQLVTKEAHKIKSYADRMNITFEEAVIEKQVIAFKKKKAAEQHNFLLSHDIKPEELKSVKTREVAFRRLLKEKII